MSGEESATVRLRPATADDIGWLAGMDADKQASGEHNWSGTEHDPVEIERGLRAKFDPNGLLDDLSGRLIVVVPDETPIGYVSWRPERWGPTPESGCPAFGIALLPRHRGHGQGTRAQRLLIEYLFRTTSTNRVQSDTAIDNPAEQRALEKAGMQREGVVRGAEYRNGRYHDHVVYGILRAEWSEWDSV